MGHASVKNMLDSDPESDTSDESDGAGRQFFTFAPRASCRKTRKKRQTHQSQPRLALVRSRSPLWTSTKKAAEFLVEMVKFQGFMESM